MRKKTLFKYVVEYIGITFGTIVMAVSIVCFLAPHMLAPGGVTGLAIVIEKITGIDISITNLVLNVPLFIIGILILGKSFGAKTFYATFALSFFINIMPSYYTTDNVLLAAIFGGVLMGIGLGIVFKSGGTTGGTDLAGAILHKFYKGISTSSFMMFIDILVVISAGLVNRKLETMLYSIITLYILVKVIDQIIEGFGYAKAFFIISSKPDELGKIILNEINRGVTVLKGRGMYTGKDREVLLCVANRAQIAKLKEVVSSVDNKAFVMVTDVHEVLGEGFKEIKSK